MSFRAVVIRINEILKWEPNNLFSQVVCRPYKTHVG